MRSLRLMLAATAVTLVVAGAATAASPPTPPTEPTKGPCAYTPLEDTTYSKIVPLPRDPHHTPDRGKVRVVIKTSQGDIPMVLERSMAPCTVQSFQHLAKQSFYDDTICHRLTTYPTLSVLQCGDPLGTGWGDPGYSYHDELPTWLDPWPDDPTGERKIYPRGTLAMANAGPDTNGSQFFLVYKDSRLRPHYNVFGRITPEGMRVLDRIAAGGVDPADPGAPLDGLPAIDVEVDRVRPGL
ncbi:peptidylprolyl isomerase [Nocardioides speluncae]|uniref:peptidylprolyl isomerase n=1 Tax=Nocardioides speluncae TaxID=2670337 RepID=UPI000D690777|nr:peptidylprolyl isomerase [Nocardioides speluncae]